MLDGITRRGINVNLTEDQPSVAGIAPLYKACAYGFLKIIQMLIDVGADDTMKNVKEETPAHVEVTEMSIVPSKKIPEEDRADYNVAN